MFCPKCLELFKIPLEELDFDLKSKKNQPNACKVQIFVLPLHRN